mmetsp:Transcript_16292/g.44320  ORF Transcript_16292/g.44320 Transcript_16292/m.44320 type:complete len:506 (-) Transcript_16292:271-1788(-)
MQRPLCEAIALFALQQRSQRSAEGQQLSAEEMERQALATSMCDESVDCVHIRQFAQSISNMFDYNWYDLVLEVCSIAAMVIAAAPIFKRCGGFTIGASLLLVMLVADIGLSLLAMLYARFSLPAVDAILSSNCIDLAFNTASHDTLVKLSEEIDRIFYLGVAELIVAVWATAVDFQELRSRWRKSGQPAADRAAGRPGTAKRRSSILAGVASITSSTSRGCRTHFAECMVESDETTQSSGRSASTREGSKSPSSQSGRRPHRKRAASVKHVARTWQQIAILMAPAIIDVLLTSVDFFVFTMAAADETQLLFASIASRGCEWCIVTSDELHLCASTTLQDGTDDDLGRGGTGGSSIAWRPNVLGTGALNLYVPAEYLLPAATLAYIALGFLLLRLVSGCRRCMRPARKRTTPAELEAQLERMPSLAQCTNRSDDADIADDHIVASACRSARSRRERSQNHEAFLEDGVPPSEDGICLDLSCMARGGKPTARPPPPCATVSMGRCDC